MLNKQYIIHGHPVNIIANEFVNTLPLGTFNKCRSFSQDANVAWRASVILLLVPGVRGGGTSCPAAPLFVPFVAVGVRSIKVRKKKKSHFKSIITRTQLSFANYISPR